LGLAQAPADRAGGEGLRREAVQAKAHGRQRPRKPGTTALGPAQGMAGAPIPSRRSGTWRCPADQAFFARKVQDPPCDAAGTHARIVSVLQTNQDRAIFLAQPDARSAWPASRG
jgi:hypothetical protein